jgi:hypothetical protein
VSDHTRADRCFSVSLFAIAICSTLLIAGVSFAGIGGSGGLQPTFDMDGSGTSDFLLTKQSNPNASINETDTVAGTSFVARGWPDNNKNGTNVEYETLGAGVFDKSAASQAQILTRKIAGANQGTLRMVQLNAAGTMRTGQFFPAFVDPAYSFFGVGDFDKDGVDDIAFWNSSTDAIRIVYMDPNNAFQVSRTEDPGTLGGDTPLGVGDADGDGRADLWLLDGTRVEILIINDTGDGFRTGILLTNLQTGEVVRGIASFNSGDDQADLLLEDTNGLVAIVHTGDNGGPTNAPPTVFPLALDSSVGEIVGTAGDYDGMNQSDFATRLINATLPLNKGMLIVRLMNAAGSDTMSNGWSGWGNPVTYDVITGLSLNPMP